MTYPVGEQPTAFRCVVCGHGKCLVAYASAVVYGPLTDREVDPYTVHEWDLFEDSIDCTVHPGAIIEGKVRGRYLRWLTCSDCSGSGRVLRGFSRVPCETCVGVGALWTKAVMVDA